MSSPDRRHLLAAMATLVLVAGCGFRPALAPGGPAAVVVNRISVADPDDRNAFDLVAQLEARLGRARTAPYRLSYRIDTGVSPLAITPENAITRYNITGSVSFKVATPAGVELTSGRVQGFAAYSATGTPVSTAAARTDAYRRLMTMLADQIVTRLVASSAGWASP